jgi:type IV secretory pathway VirB4 component
MTGAALLDLIGKYAGLFVTTALASGSGAFLGSYLKKKGENLATHEDIDKLVAQISAVTTTAKQIEATISNEMWQRQTIRNEKKAAYCQVLEILGQMRHAVDTLRVGPTSQGAGAASNKLDDLRQELYRIAPCAIMVLNVPANTAFDTYRRIAEPALKLDPATTERWEREGEAIGNTLTALIAAGRSDLGF